MENKEKAEREDRDRSGEIEVTEIAEIIDIEEFYLAASEGKLPHAKKYKIRIDKEKFIVDVSHLSGRQLLALAGKTPVEQWMVNQKVKGQVLPIGLDEIVDLTAPGVERFMTLPKDQTEGRPAPRKLFALPEEDVDLLDAAGLHWEAVSDGGSQWLIVHQIPLPVAFVQRDTSVAFQIPSAYPSAALDMGYFFPPVKRVDGRNIPCTEAVIQIEETPGSGGHDITPRQTHGNRANTIFTLTSCSRRLGCNARPRRGSLMEARSLRLTGEQHEMLKKHLFPGDNKEAVALGLCGRLAHSAGHVLCLHSILPIPYEHCTERHELRVSWPTEIGRDLFEVAAKKSMAIINFIATPDIIHSFRKWMTNLTEPSFHRYTRGQMMVFHMRAQ